MESIFSELNHYQETTNNRLYFGVVNGKKVDSLMFEPSRYAILSPDNQHVAYIVADAKDTYYVIYDEKRIGPFQDFVSFENSKKWLFIFGSDNKLYFLSKEDSKNDWRENKQCLYINGEQQDCRIGYVSNLVFQGSSVSYILLNSANDSVILNNIVYGPYERQGHDYFNPIISPDGSKVAYSINDDIFINGEHIGSSPIEDLGIFIYRPIIFFTPDSQHIVYFNYIDKSKIEVRVDSRLVQVIDLQSFHISENRPYYFIPAPDKKSVWFLYVDETTKAMMIKNIKLGL